MVNVEVNVSVDAPQEYVYELQASPRLWVDWAGTMERVEPVGEPGFDIGSRWSMKPWGMKAAVWEVTEVYPGKEFAWVTKMPGGIKVEARHIVEARGAGSYVTIQSNTSGLLASIFKGSVERKFRAIMDREAEGLKRYAEERAPAAVG